jgi:methyl-accepting chemotaxis protein
MFKNLRLSAKMALGFGAIVAVALVLGLTGWYGISRLANTFSMTRAGNECLNLTNSTGLLRREFAIQGFAVAAGQTQNAAEKWQVAYQHMVDAMDSLRSRSGLPRRHRETLESALQSAHEYEQAFGLQKESQSIKDESFARWGKIGWEITGEIQTVLEEVIAPAQQRARASNNTAAMSRWARISESLDRDFVEPFLLLRVYAVYLAKTDADKQWEGFQKQLATVKEGLSGWRALVGGNAELEAVASQFGRHIADYEQSGIAYYNGVSKRREADRMMASSAAAIMSSIQSIEEGLSGDMEAITSRTNALMLIMTIIGILAGITLAFVITRSIVGPLNRIIKGLGEGSDQVASASEQLSGSSQQMSEGASEQASSLEEVSSSLEEMSSMTKQNAGNSQQVNGLMEETKSLVGKGQESMGALSGAINEIKDSSDATARIIKTIDEIAMQTNLLALNAAVEAARAGEAGRGFAVVAEEVRNLAQRSAEAAKNTAELIETSQLNSEKGVTVAQDTNAAITAIAESSSKVAGLVAEIAAASSEQSQGIDQINTAVAQMDQVTQTNAANAEESASASEELAGQAQSLNGMIAELVSLIGATDGRSAYASGGQSIRASGMRSVPKRALAANASAQTHPGIERRAGAKQSSHGGQSAQTHAISPETVIPLDSDENLSDF